jgi:hypothetical protein
VRLPALTGAGRSELIRRSAVARVQGLFMNTSSNNEVWVVFGAGDLTRTGDIQLGSNPLVFELRGTEKPCRSIRFGICGVALDTPASVIDQG